MINLVIIISTVIICTDNNIYVNYIIFDDMMIEWCNFYSTLNMLINKYVSFDSQLITVLSFKKP